MLPVVPAKAGISLHMDRHRPVGAPVSAGVAR